MLPPHRLIFSQLRAVVLLIGILAAASLFGEESRLNLRLPNRTRGNDAVRALGANLPELAHSHGMDAQQFATLLRAQPSLEVERNGNLVCSCPGVPANAPIPSPVGAPKIAPSNTPNRVSSDAPLANSSTVQLATGTAVDAFRLHSRPGANRVIYLDFDGHTATGTLWNDNYTAGAPIVSQPFDLDGNPANFSPAERTLIESIWKRVAEDYAPFAIDVTTEDPGVEALRKTSPSDNAFGIRVVISPTNWYNTGAGGTAYVGSFDWNTDTPCWVFTQQLANSEKYISEATAHEVGHTLGLFHDGVAGSSPTEYYGGQGDWAPIMGLGYYKRVTQFSKGDYANANNVQDDLAVIAGYAPLVADDYGNTLTSATPLTGPNVSVFGTIERSTDVDVFKFTTSGCSLALTIQGLSPEPNLNIKAELLNSASTVLQSSNPAGLSAALNGSLASGTYYVRISGTGDGDPATTGYPAYGSVGNYLITGLIGQAPSAVATASPTSGLVPLAVGFSSNGSADADGTIVSYLWNFGNGATSTAANPNYTYTTAGNFVATLTVTDNSGLTGSASVTLTVNAAAPSITTQPTGSTVVAGTVATFTAATSGAPTPTVQWRRNGSAISGATAATLSFTATALDAGSYTMLATNSVGTAETAAAALIVNKVAQTVSFAPAAELYFTTSAVPLSATATSGLPVTFTVQAGPATLAGGGLSLSGPGTVTVRAMQAGNEIYQAASTDRSILIKPNFLSWQQGQFSTAELADSTRSGPNAVYGLDGLPNLVKYGLGLDPKINVTSGLPETSAAGSDWTYTYTRPASVTDVVYTVEFSSDLATWTTTGVTHDWVSTAGGVDTWRGRYPLASAPVAFFRLKVTQP